MIENKTRFDSYIQLYILPKSRKVTRHLYYQMLQIERKIFSRTLESSDGGAYRYGNVISVAKTPYESLARVRAMHQEEARDCNF